MPVSDLNRPAPLHIGKVFGDTFRVLGRNIVLCIVLPVIFSGIPAYVLRILMDMQSHVILDQSPTSTSFVYALQAVIVPLVLSLLSLVGTVVLEAALVRATIEDLNGRKPTLSDSIGRGIAVLIPATGLTLIMNLAIGAGLMLLVVPGVFLFLCWSVATPVLVQERRGIFDSILRSAALTAGNRWRILLPILILYVFPSVTLLTANLLAPAVEGSAFWSSNAAMLAGLSVICLPLPAVVQAVVYVQLRHVTADADSREVAEIFA